MANTGQSPMKRPVSPWVGVIVILICIALVLLIYRFTVGRRVSMEAPPDAQTSPFPEDPSLEGSAAGGPGESHATPVDDDEVRTRAEDEKQPLPPGESGDDGG